VIVSDNEQAWKFVELFEPLQPVGLPFSIVFSGVALNAHFFLRGDVGIAISVIYI
jgi:hypothetical protein